MLNPFRSKRPKLSKATRTLLTECNRLCVPSYMLWIEPVYRCWVLRSNFQERIEFPTEEDLRALLSYAKEKTLREMERSKQYTPMTRAEKDRLIKIIAEGVLTHAEIA